MSSNSVTIVGRSSSHFTRTLRMLAHELDVPYSLAPLYDLGSRAVADYAGNPALKIPILVTEDGPWFGALSAARELARRAREPARIVWPEQVKDRLASNAQELVLSAMATEVQVLMGNAAGASELPKARASLVGSLEWLEQHMPAALAQTERADAVSYLAITTFCLVTHLHFRQVLDTTPFAGLCDFCAAFGERASARATEYRFDAPPA